MIHYSPMPEVVGSFDIDRATEYSRRKTRFNLEKNSPHKIPLSTRKSFAALDVIKLQHSVSSQLLKLPKIYVGKTRNHVPEASTPHLDGIYSKVEHYRIIHPRAQLIGASCVPTVCLVGWVEFSEREPYIFPGEEEISIDSKWMQHGVFMDLPKAQEDICTAFDNGDLEAVRFEPGDVVMLHGDTLHNSDSSANLALEPDFRLLFSQMFLPDY